MPVGVPQGSILGPLLFFIYVNDLPNCHLESDIVLYADDTVIYYSSKNLTDLQHHINAGLETVLKWFSSNLLTLNKCMISYIEKKRKKYDKVCKVNTTYALK